MHITFNLTYPCPNMELNCEMGSNFIEILKEGVRKEKICKVNGIINVYGNKRCPLSNGIAFAHCTYGNYKI